MPAPMTASAHGPVRPVWEHPSPINFNVNGFDALTSVPDLKTVPGLRMRITGEVKLSGNFIARMSRRLPRAATP